MLDQMYGTGWVIRRNEDKSFWVIDEVQWFDGEDKGYLYTLKGIDDTNEGQFKRYYEQKMTTDVVIYAQDESAFAELLFKRPKAKVYSLDEYRNKRKAG